MKKFLFLFLCSSFCYICFAQVRESVKFPFVIKKDGEIFVSKNGISCPIIDEKEIHLLDKIISGSFNETDLTNQDDYTKALKFSKMLKADESIKEKKIIPVGKNILVVFKIPNGSKLRDGMNFLFFEFKEGKFFWNVSANDSLFIQLASSINNSKALSIGEQNIKKITLPFDDIKRDDKVLDKEIVKFYVSAQKIFYDWKLDEYSKFLTSESRRKYDSQFKNMPEEDRRNFLTNYFKWKKDMLCVRNFGDFSLIFFDRINPEESYKKRDFVYIFHTQDAISRYEIGNFGASPSSFDRFISEYFLKEKNFTDIFVEKFETQK